jgi:acetyl-CoA synthetase
MATTIDVVWRPDPQTISSSNLKRFMDRFGIASYDELYRRSIGDIAWFWDAVLKDLDIRFRQPYSTVVDLTPGKPFPRWCVDGHLNITESCLDKWVKSGAGERARCYEAEDGAVEILTYSSCGR